MIEPEPLKGKTKFGSKGSKASSKKKWYMTRDIRSAVEWLANEVICSNPDCKCCGRFAKKVGQAFEDVVKKEKEE